MKLTRILNTIFRNVWFFFSSEHLSDSDLYPCAILYEVLPQRLSVPALVEMTNHVALLQRAGLPIIIDILTEEIPDGYIGKMSVWIEGLSECPRCWLLPQGYFDKTRSVTLQPDWLYRSVFGGS